MQLWKKISDLIVDKSLVLKKSASLTLTDPNGVANPMFPFVKTKTAAFTVPTSENGATYILSLAAGFATTLPAPFAGANYTFIVGISNTGDHTIVGGSGTIFGDITTSNVQAASAAPSSASGVTTITLKANTSVKGDQVHVVSDGTAWFVSGITAVQGGATLT